MNSENSNLCTHCWTFVCGLIIRARNKSISIALGMQIFSSHFFFGCFEKIWSYVRKTADRNALSPFFIWRNHFFPPDKYLNDVAAAREWHEIGSPRNKFVRVPPYSFSYGWKMNFFLLWIKFLSATAHSKSLLNFTFIKLRTMVLL